MKKIIKHLTTHKFKLKNDNLKAIEKLEKNNYFFLILVNFIFSRSWMRN